MAVPGASGAWASGAWAEGAWLVGAWGDAAAPEAVGAGVGGGARSVRRNDEAEADEIRLRHVAWDEIDALLARQLEAPAGPVAPTTPAPARPRHAASASVALDDGAVVEPPAAIAAGVALGADAAQRARAARKAGDDLALLLILAAIEGDD